MTGLFKRLARALALAPFAMLPFGSPLAQDSSQQDAGLTARLTVGQRLDYENRSGSVAADEGVSTITDLGFVLHSKTRSQAFRLSLDGGLRYEINDNGRGAQFDLDDPQMALSYTVQSRATRLGFAGSYRRADIDDIAFDDADLSDDTSTGGGTRTNTQLGTNIELGRDAPFGAVLSYDTQTTRYADTPDAALVDLDTDIYAAQLRFDISPQLQLSTFADLSDRDAAGPGSSDLRSTQYGIGAAYKITPRTKATARLFHTKLDSDDNAGSTARIQGGGFAFGLAHSVANGSLTFDTRQQQTINGAERELTLGRSFTFKRGTLGLTTGLSKTDGLKAEPLIGLALGYELDALSRITVNLSQSTSVDDDNDATLTARLSLGYTRALSETSSLSAALSLAQRDVKTTDGQDQRATRLSLTHQYALGRDVALVSGYSYAQSTRDGRPDTERSRLFAGLERTFNLRP